MGQTPKIAPTQSIALWVGGVLLLPRGKGYQTIHYWALQKYLEVFIK